MLRKFISRKRNVVVLTAVAALAIAGAAFAYLSSQGSGTGTGSVSTSSAALALTGTTPALTAIGDTKTMTITASNSGANPEKVVSIAAGAAQVASGCPAGSFTLGQFTYTNNEVPAASNGTPGTAVVATVPVTFNDNTGAPQDACLSGYSFSFTSN